MIIIVAFREKVTDCAPAQGWRKWHRCRFWDLYPCSVSTAWMWFFIRLCCASKKGSKPSEMLGAVHGHCELLRPRALRTRRRSRPVTDCSTSPFRSWATGQGSSITGVASNFRGNVADFIIRTTDIGDLPELARSRFWKEGRKGGVTHSV